MLDGHVRRSYRNVLIGHKYGTPPHYTMMNEATRHPCGLSLVCKNCVTSSGTPSRPGTRLDKGYRMVLRQLVLSVLSISRFRNASATGYHHSARVQSAGRFIVTGHVPSGLSVDPLTPLWAVGILCRRMAEESPTGSAREAVECCAASHLHQCIC